MRADLWTKTVIESSYKETNCGGVATFAIRCDLKTSMLD